MRYISVHIGLFSYSCRTAYGLAMRFLESVIALSPRLTIRVISRGPAHRGTAIIDDYPLESHTLWLAMDWMIRIRSACYGWSLQYLAVRRKPHRISSGPIKVGYPSQSRLTFGYMAPPILLLPVTSLDGSFLKMTSKLVLRLLMLSKVSCNMISWKRFRCTQHW